MKPTHVAIEGPIGVGKTTLAKRLATHWGARTVLEDPANPFLPDFYAGKPGAAFDCQLFFLLQRFRQQRELVQQDLFQHSTVADYLFDKDRIFAYLNLEQADLNVYETVFSALAGQVAKPDLVVFLQASDDALMARIRKRGRPHEQALSREYVSELNKAYNYYFFHYQDTPLLVVNATHVDLAGSDAAFTELLRQVDDLEGGTRWFVPAC